MSSLLLISPLAVQHDQAAVASPGPAGADRTGFIVWLATGITSLHCIAEIRQRQIAQGLLGQWQQGYMACSAEYLLQRQATLTA